MTELETATQAVRGIAQARCDGCANERLSADLSQTRPQSWPPELHTCHTDLAAVGELVTAVAREVYGAEFGSWSAIKVRLAALFPQAEADK